MGEKKKSLAQIYAAENGRVAKLAEGVEVHGYEPSRTGMCCGAMVMRDGGGDQCGLPFQHVLHIGPKDVRAAAEAEAAAEAKKPLAEIREREFAYAREVQGGVPMATALSNTVTTLYDKVTSAGYIPADVTLTIDISTGPPSRFGGPQTTIAAKVSAWEAVAL